MVNQRKYREAERRLWEWAGLEPSETWATLRHTGTRVRVQEIGSGEPVLFIHGGPNAGATWAPMLRFFDGFRALVVDRPGTGLSDPYKVTAANVATFGAGFVSGVLDGLDLDRAHVVASSFGGHLALRSAAAHPQRFRRMVQMGAPAVAPGQTYPPFMKSMRSKLVRTMMNLLPPNRRINLGILRQIGHGASLDAGSIPDMFIDWYMDLARYTDTMRNDGHMIGAELLPNLEDFSLTWELLGSVTTPTLFLWGADDGFGGEDHAGDVCGALPNADLVMIPRAGHLPWIDDPRLVAEKTAEFLAAHDDVQGDVGRRAT